MKLTAVLSFIFLGLQAHAGLYECQFAGSGQLLHVEATDQGDLYGKVNCQLLAGRPVVRHCPAGSWKWLLESHNPRFQNFVCHEYIGVNVPIVREF